MDRSNAATCTKSSRRGSGGFCTPFHALQFFLGIIKVARAKGKVLGCRDAVAEGHAHLKAKTPSLLAKTGDFALATVRDNGETQSASVPRFVDLRYASNNGVGVEASRR